MQNSKFKSIFTMDGKLLKQKTTKIMNPIIPDHANFFN